MPTRVEQAIERAAEEPATVTHTFAKKGKFRVYLFVAQQQQYGGVQYQTYVDVTPG